MKKPKPKYRILRKGEKLEKGDEFETWDHRWRKTVTVGVIITEGSFKYRRRVKEKK